jgi:4-hydroxy-4-methyl-2-oxoglutarate aldolase
MTEFRFEDIRQPKFDRVAVRTLVALRQVQGLTATASDILDAMGWNLVVPAALLPSRFGKPVVIAGQALTLRYVPERRRIDTDEALTAQSKLAHQLVFGLARPGDVMVVEASVRDPISVLGGRAATAGVNAGLAGAIVDGGVRDIEEIRSAGFPVWSKWVTPLSGKGRLEPVTINGPVSCLGVQVQPGDLVLADETGVCFIPLEIVSEVVVRIFEIAKQEAGDLRVRRVPRPKRHAPAATG